MCETINLGGTKLRRWRLSCERFQWLAPAPQAHEICLGFCAAQIAVLRDISAGNETRWSSFCSGSGPRKSYVQRVPAEAEVAGSPLALLPVVLLKHNPRFKSAAVKRKALRKQTPSKHILNFISSGGPPCFCARFHGSLCIIFFSSSSNFNSCPTRGCSFRGFQPWILRWQWELRQGPDCVLSPFFPLLCSLVFKLSSNIPHILFI